VADGYGFANAALEFDLHLPAHGERAVYIAIPFHDADTFVSRSSGAGPEAEFDRALAATAEDWRRRLGCVEFAVPAAAQDLVQTLKSSVAYMIINRNGAAIQPGSRTYSRAWIRDGALISASLLAMGFPEEVRDFIRWYAGFQYADGRVPCCVDRHGADALPEHDSNGEFLFAIAEYYRYTRDIGFVYELWGPIVQAVRFLDALRAQRLTAPYSQPDKRKFYGLLPESVSHEGYVARPVHSYWDDFFAIRGLKDAVVLATALGEDAEAARMAAVRDALRHDVHASIQMVIAEQQLDYVPASVELADFDPSATAIALAPAGELARLPAPQTARTFERYYEEVERRQRGEAPWEVYAPYTLRTVGALLRLGERDREFAVLDEIVADRRPRAWNQWPEMIWHDALAPRFIGDMPHTWVASDYVTAVRSLFAYEREEDRALVIAAGIPAAWVSEEPVGVRRLPTHYGILSYHLRRESPTRLRMRIAGDLGLPPGGIVVQPPLPAALTMAAVNGRAVPHDGDRARVDDFPAEVLLEYGGMQ
jgi:GH15 family glucan-1,4-alpha-glucosidase